MLEKGRQFCDFQGEANPNKYFIKRCLGSAATTLPSTGMHFVSDSEQQQLYCPSFVVLHHLLPPIPRPIASSLLLPMTASPVHSSGLAVSGFPLPGDGLLGYVFIMQELLKWITLK